MDANYMLVCEAKGTALMLGKRTPDFEGRKGQMMFGGVKRPGSASLPPPADVMRAIELFVIAAGEDKIRILKDTEYDELAPPQGWIEYRFPEDFADR